MEKNGKTLLLMMIQCFIWVDHTGVAEFATQEKVKKLVKKHKLLSVILSLEVLWPYRGKTEIRIIDKGTKVNSKYYCEQVLKPFLDNDVPRLFPDDPESMVFHHDSASSHAARETIQFLKNNNMNFIDKEEWMPKSPDAAPMDFGIREFSSAVYKSGMLTF